MKTTMYFLILFLFCLSGQTFAWNSRGHMIVAAIAYMQLNEGQKSEVTELLKSHPFYKSSWSKEYKKINTEIELGQFLLMRASIWPDEIRKNIEYDHPNWHFITYRIDFENGHDSTAIDGNVEPNVVWACEQARRSIEDNTHSKSERAIQLAWLIHLIGDIHQPLHCASLFNITYPNGDKGGNKFYIKPNTAGVKLHSLWDGALGTGGKGKEIAIKKQTEKILLDNEVPTAFNLKKFNPRQWSLESFTYAINNVHKKGNLKGSATEKKAPALPNDYEEKMERLATERCIVAGVRLGNVMNKLSIPL